MSNYTDPRLVAVYEVLNPAAADTAFYLDLAGAGSKAILDMGCGTGLLACAFAARGHRVSGADPAAAMLDFARRRPGGGAVDWVEADAAGLSLETRFDLIVMTGHAFQVLLDDLDIRAALRNLRRHLAPGGRIAFETRNPAVRPWTGWVRDQTRRTVEVPGVGSVEVSTELTSFHERLAAFDTHFHFADGASVVTSSQLRFTTPDDLSAFLTEAGLAVAQLYGDWDRSAYHPASREIIVMASRI